MRSPMLAFSLFAAAVGPTIVTAAPSSPKLGDENSAHGRSGEVKLHERLVHPRAPDDTSPLGNLPGGLPGLPGGDTEGGDFNGIPGLDFFRTLLLPLAGNSPVPDAPSGDHPSDHTRVPDTTRYHSSTSSASSTPTLPSLPDTALPSPTSLAEAYPIPPPEPTPPAVPTHSPAPTRTATPPRPTTSTSTAESILPTEDSTTGGTIPGSGNGDETTNVGQAAGAASDIAGPETNDVSGV
ncbi:hypothetical protein C8T65DRAFT_824660 [Cerioporus squamosus]|nr:hypothetical protein C8T65DRAFT_824660 [Cerioporus squamosus]